jgi:hypothetical protein
MGYRKIKPVMVDIFGLARECGLFTSDTELNGGYGCLSKSKDKSEHGCCYGFDCPLAYTPSLADMKEHDIDIYNEWKETIQEKYKEYNWDYDDKNEDNYDPENYGSEWVVQWREVV